VIAALLLSISLGHVAIAQSRDAAATAKAAGRAPRKNASVAGRIIHADGAAAEGARVAVYAVREGAPAAIVATTTSAHDGRYQVGGLPAGQFVVGVTPQRVRGFGGDSRRLSTPAVETFYPGTSQRLSAQPIDVFNGTPTEGIDIWLEPAARRYSISGRVLWPEKTEAVKAVIEYGGPEGVHGGVWFVSDPGGLFTIEGASRGTYVLLARAETADGPLMGIAATNVANDSVHDVQLTLRMPGSIEGRVVVEGTGGPDPATLRLTATHALLTTSPLYPSPDTTPDSTGRFTMTDLIGEFTFAVQGLPPGWRSRRVTRGGAALPDNRVTVMPGERVAGIEVVVTN
jgi:hypothetical protein